MQQLLYLSTASHIFAEADLLTLLAQTRAYNQEHGITGLLLYGQGHFMQWLEGEPAVLVPLYERIQADARHQRVTTLVQQTSSRRCFPSWAMAFYSLAPAADWPPSFVPLDAALLDRCRHWAHRAPVLEPLHSFALQALPHSLRDALRT